MSLVGKTMMVRRDLKRHDRGEYVYMTQQIFDCLGQVGVVVYKNNELPVYRLQIGDKTIGWVQEDWLVPALIDNRSL